MKPAPLPLLLLIACLGLSGAPAAAADAETEAAKASRKAIAVADDKFALTDVLPIGFNMRPRLYFNVLTEMTPEGRARRVPTPAEPMYYTSVPATQGTFGPLLQQVGERPPSAAAVEEAMKKALAENGYLPVSDAQRRPDLLIVFRFGSNGVADELLEFNPEAISAEDVFNSMLRVPGMPQVMIERVRFIAGDKIAAEFEAAVREEVVNWSITGAPRNPNPASPFQMFLSRHFKDRVEHLINTAFFQGYVATATAYDFAGVAERKKVALWQTRMLVDARGVTMDEALPPLILTTAPYIGRETEAVVIEKRIHRDGHVEIGTAEVVRDPAATAPSATPAPAEKR